MPYPQINFTTSRRNAVTTSPPWRDGIAIVGEFSKGPAELVKVSGENFELYFGSDATEGSANVQQALELGATNIWVSRAVPEDTPSKGSIYVASGNTYGVEPQVGHEYVDGQYNPVIDETNYTVGLSLQVEYIGTPIVNRTLIGKVSTKTADLDHPNFTDKDEQGEVVFTVVDFKDGAANQNQQADVASEITLDVVAGDAGDKQVVAINKTDNGTTNQIDSIDQVIQPGYVFRGKQGTDNVRLQILSKPFSLTPDKWGVLVENLTAIGAADVTEAKVFSPEESTYVIGYKTNIVEAGSLSAYTDGDSYLSLGATFENDAVSEPQDSFFAVKAIDAARGWLEFRYDTLTGDLADKTAAFDVKSEGFHETDAAEGIQLLFGELADATPLPLLVGGQFSVLFANGYALAGATTASSADAFTVGTTGKAVISALYKAVNNSSTMNALVENLTLEGTIFPYGLVFDTVLRGVESTRLKYKLTRHVAGASASAADLYFDVNKQGFETGADLDALTASFVTGGYSGPTYDEVDFFALDGTPILKVQAVSPGAQNLKVSLSILDTPSLDQNQYLLVTQGTYDNKPYTETIRLDTRNINSDNGLFTQSQTSAFVRVYFTPYLEYDQDVLTSEVLRKFTAKVPARTAPPLAVKSNDFSGIYGVAEYGPTVLRDVALTGGTDYTIANTTISAKEIRKRAYLSAIGRLDVASVAFVGITGISYGDPFYAEVFDEAIEQTKKADVENGLRQLFLQVPANMPAKRAVTLSDEINHPFVTLVNGNVVQSLANNGNRRQIGVLGYYMGTLATRPPFISPHATYGGTRINSIISSSVKATKQFKTDITLGRVDTVYFDNGLQTWKFLNGLTTSSNFSERYVSVSRIRIQIISDLYVNLQPYRSQPNTPEVRGQVESAVNAYMNTIMQRGWISQLGAIISDETNNSASDIARGIINVSIAYLPVLPADFINVELIENYALVDTLALVPAA